MASMKDWFEANRYQPKLPMGTRVFGWIKDGKVKYPFMGMGSDSLRSEEEGVMVTVTLDLPLKIKDKVHMVIRVPFKDISVAKEIK